MTQDLDQLAKSLQDIVKKTEETSYQKGWDDAMEAVQGFIKGAVRPHVRLVQTSLFSSPQKKGSPFRRGTGMSNLYSYIKDHPGLTGVEIVRGMKAEGMEIAERTARTGMHRMKTRGYAANEGGKWFIR